MKTILLAFLVLTALGCGATEQQLLKSEPFTGVISASQLITEYPLYRSAYE
jgi:thioredoxin 1